MTFSNRYARLSKLYKENELLDIDGFINLAKGKFMHKFYYGTLPSSFHN